MIITMYSMLYTSCSWWVFTHPNLVDVIYAETCREALILIYAGLTALLTPTDGNP